MALQIKFAVFGYTEKPDASYLSMTRGKDDE